MMMMISCLLVNHIYVYIYNEIANFAQKIILQHTKYEKTQHFS